MKLPQVSIAELVGSSKYAAIADDSLKDEDNAAWVMFLPANFRLDFIELFSWIRQIDRMAENEWTEGWGSRFQIFKIGWRTLLLTQLVLPDDYHAKLLLRMRRRWFSRRSGEEPGVLPVVHAWDEYVEATAEYHRSDMVFDTISAYQWMLEHLGGSLFQIFSFLTEAQRRSVRAFGVVDLFFNHLRDLPEDTAQGLCYFPTDVLDRFGVDREEILNGSCLKNSGYVHMMHFWLNDYLPHLYRQAADFLNDNSLHFTWQILRHWFLRRHARLKRALLACGMDFRAATDMYYADVKPNLGTWVEESFAIAGRLDLLREKDSEPGFEWKAEPESEPAAPASAADSFDSLPPIQGMTPMDSGSWGLVLGQRHKSPAPTK
jgi:phytoene synthase